MNIYVGNLPIELTEDELRQEFTAFGQVKSVTVMNNRDIGSGQPWGYGFVEMVSESEGDAAISSLRDKIIRGRAIEVIKSLPFTDNKDKTSSDSRRGSRFNRTKQRATRNRSNRLP
jgi:RNA recognition motif-containing protein